MRFSKFLIVAALFAAPLLLLPSMLSAQSIVTGAVSGTVTDPSGAVIVGATVNLKNVATGEVSSTNTNSSGGYQFPLLKPGSYTVNATQQGFKQSSITVDVLLGQTSTADLKLELGAGSVTVEVTGQGQGLQTEDANISSNFDTKMIQEVPNPGNDITYIAQTAPGVAMNSTGGYGNFTAFGLPATANLFTVNGNDYNDPYLNLNNSGSSNLLLGGNELQEVAVVSNGYTGQYGRQAGAQIDYSTKSGSNQFHGNAVYDWTGRALSANDYFNNLFGNPRPFENNNQWAASFGGPIKKDKAFFFVNTEGIRYVFGTSASVSVPTPDFEQYVLSQIPTTAVPYYNNIFSLYNNAPNVNHAIPAANSCGASLGSFPDPVTGSTSATCLQTFNNSGSNGNREWLVTGRVDYSFSENDKLFGRVKVDRGVQPSYTDPIDPAFNVISHQPQQDAQVNYTHVFNPNLINNFIASAFYYGAPFASNNIAAALAAYPGVLVSTDSALTPLGTGSSFFPGVATSFPNGRKVTQWGLVDDLSLTRGNHTFKMGFNFRRNDASDSQAAVGTQFPYVSTSLASFATDQADFITQNFTNFPEQPIAYYSLGLYFQDEYRVNSRLKFTLAMRADRNSNGVCQSDCAVRSVDPFDQLAHNPNIPYNQMMLTGQHSILRNVEKVVFEPRVGFAWSPLGQNTVIRGGVGLFTDLYPGSLLNLWTRNFPSVTAFGLASAGTIDNIGTATKGSAATVIGECQTVFQTNYAAGGTASDFLANAPAGCAVPNMNDVANTLKNPKYLEWNLEVQHSFGNKAVLSVNYVGNRGYDGVIFNPYLNAYAHSGFGGLPTAPIDSRVGLVLQGTNNGISNYNGITFSLQQNTWHGLSGRINYTYSHALDDISNGGTLEPYNPADSLFFQISPNNLRLNYGNADYDIRHVMTGNYVWQIPVRSENRLLNAAIGGWEVSGTIFAHTGLPFSVIDGPTGSSLIAANGANDQLITVLGQPIVPVSRSCTAVLNPNNSSANACWGGVSAFSSAPTSFGTLARNAFRGPGYFDTDFSLRKSFRLTERLGFMVGANAYNVLNHVNFANPNVNLAAGPNFGLITATQNPATSPYGAFAAAAVDARIVQVVGRLTF